MKLDFLDQEHSLPEGHGHDKIVQWHVFRDRERAEHFADHVELGEGQELVGGWTRDSVGKLYWVGVHVEDLERWGNVGAVHKHTGRPS
ncbi:MULTISPECIES: hypothetical protein [unclassified Thioalkalivibrio]|jgi:hypothetical protein|uniref:hypothetical protein n=1 Tax=unclassified Thioalkalivibrio TaxID=2621013 RepID=UPI0001959C35|nr:MULTISPECIES: hypothetical protein [unclassified Thioalkalivibrio]ADC72476.1 conserved hypothetical protein [Thioalkalivibrio sp. K90mix]